MHASKLSCVACCISLLILCLGPGLPRALDSSPQPSGPQLLARPPTRSRARRESVGAEVRVRVPRDADLCEVESCLQARGTQHRQADAASVPLSTEEEGRHQVGGDWTEPCSGDHRREGARSGFSAQRAQRQLRELPSAQPHREADRRGGRQGAATCSRVGAAGCHAHGWRLHEDVADRRGGCLGCALVGDQWCHSLLRLAPGCVLRGLGMASLVNREDGGCPRHHARDSGSSDILVGPLCRRTVGVPFARPQRDRLDAHLDSLMLLAVGVIGATALGHQSPWERRRLGWGAGSRRAVRGRAPRGGRSAHGHDSIAGRGGQAVKVTSCSGGFERFIRISAYDPSGQRWHRGLSNEHGSRPGDCKTDRVRAGHSCRSTFSIGLRAGWVRTLAASSRRWLCLGLSRFEFLWLVAGPPALEGCIARPSREVHVKCGGLVSGGAVEAPRQHEGASGPQLDRAGGWALRQLHQLRRELGQREGTALQPHGQRDVHACDGLGQDDHIHARVLEVRGVRDPLPPGVRTAKSLPRGEDGGRLETNQRAPRLRSGRAKSAGTSRTRSTGAPSPTTTRSCRESKEICRRPFKTKPSSPST